MEKKLEVRNLQINFRTQAGILKAVRNISFDLYQGETLAIVGESGSGKSVTSKAIIGILSGNSIVEGGEILYDGKDLLKIDEEDFHKIRGDKIAMIFQDPMSSLNPIMRIGQQLTEAMILKAKVGKKNARREFNTLLAKLNEYICLAHQNEAGFNKSSVDELTKTFDNFCIKANTLEQDYNEAHGSLTEFKVEIDDIAFLIERHQKLDAAKKFKGLNKKLTKGYHPFIVNQNADLDALLLATNNALALDDAEENIPTKVKALRELSAYISTQLEKEEPNFFRLGYYLLSKPDADVYSMDINDLNNMTLDYLNENFMVNFINVAKAGVLYSHNESIESKKEILGALIEAKEYFSNLDGKKRSDVLKYAKELSKKVWVIIDKLEVKKNSTEYTFESVMKSEINAYFNGIENNPKEEAKYKKNEAKYNALIEKGKTPDWVLKPQIIVDLELKKNNIIHTVDCLIDSINKDITENENYDSEAKVIEMIDFFKDQASKVVVKMNKTIAKAQAIKLLEEVGIPEPNIRFNQYPFELSGGMRQRIVIAIALSANPDILICDEPTTALDVTIQSQILELINRIKEERHLSVIFITHNLGVVANMADRIAVMYAGKIVEMGTSEEIFYEPRHPYTWALLSSMPDLHTKDKLESIPGTPPNMIYPPKGDAFAARNKYALDIDFELEPPMFEVSETHHVASWLVHPNAPKIEMPKIIKDRVARFKEEFEKSQAANNKEVDE